MAVTSSSTYTPTALRRWGCQDKPLPNVQQIKELHIYDFDNTRKIDALNFLQCDLTDDIGCSI
jgi:hypothetical protein